MKRTIEQQLVDATPQGRGNSAFVERTMRAIKARASHETFSDAVRKTNVPKKEHFIMKLKHLPVPALAALVIAVLLLTSGTIYAAIRFAPDLIKILGKTTNESGRVEYNVPNFADCQNEVGAPKTNTFQLKKDAPTLSDSEVKKIIQAKCELKWVDGFVRETWQSYGDYPQRKPGDTIHYTHPDLIGTLRHIDKNSASISSLADVSRNYNVVPGRSIEAYVSGKKVSASQLKPGDVVFSIVRVSEKYFERCTTSCDTQPQAVALVALIKLNLPAEYYSKMQNYLTEVPQCFGNTDEYCQQTFPQIDVFPAGSEGAGNSAFDTSNHIRREIIGKITKLQSGSLILQTSRGTEYSLRITENGFDEYNAKYAPNHHDPNAFLQVGDSISVRYSQSPGDDPRTIALDQVSRVTLLFESSNPKESPLKKY